MKNHSLLYVALILVAIFAIFHFISMHFYLYWMYWWADTIMHFMAGVCGGLATYGVLFHPRIWKKELPRVSRRVILVLVCVMIVGVLWEVLEYIYGIAAEPGEYIFDTTKDLILDAVGSVIAVFIASKVTSSNG